MKESNKPPLGHLRQTCFELELELVQTQMRQKPMFRAEEGCCVVLVYYSFYYQQGKVNHPHRLGSGLV